MEEFVDLKIKAVMSLPRVGWNDAWGCIQDALMPFRIPVTRFSGAFWGQCMQRALSEAVEQGCDWVLTIDYDSMFTPVHVSRMLQHFGDNPHIDALAPLQMRRSAEYPLLTIKGSSEGDRIDVNRFEPFEVNTAHFGMTLLRLEALKDLKKPWFYSTPDSNGDWELDGEKVDDDIYFWHRWKEAGKTIYVAPDVSIGHLEVMVSQFTQSGGAEHLYVKDWRSRYASAS